MEQVQPLSWSVQNCPGFTAESLTSPKIPSVLGTPGWMVTYQRNDQYLHGEFVGVNSLECFPRGIKRRSKIDPKSSYGKAILVTIKYDMAFAIST